MADEKQIRLGVTADTNPAKSQLEHIIDLLERLANSAKRAKSGAKEATSAANEAAKKAKAYADAFKQRAKVAAEAEKKQNEWVANYQKMQAASQSAQQKMLKDMYGTAFKKYDQMQSQMVDQTDAPMQRFRDNLKNNGLQEFKNTLKSMDYPFKNFTKSLMRIAKLRLLRGIIRSITGAFKEGAQNLYYYSAALNSADGARFANSMNSIATSLLYMKNSIGAAVAPLITSLVPAIQTVVNWFVTATQAVAQFFAALGGQVMYTRAKEQATTWKDVGNAVGGAAAAAKEYENTILGFDELNVLNDPSQGGGGGGGGAATPDYSSMFEEADISKKIRDLTQWIKDNFEDIKDLAITIGGILLGWKIANNVADFFSRLGFANAAGIRELGLGITLVITGVALATKGGFDIAYEGVDLMNVIKTALGIGLAGAGGALGAHALTSLGIASVGTGVGAVFGIGIALVGTIIGFTIGEGKKQREAIISDLETYDGEFALIMDRQSSYVEEAELAWSQYSAMLGKAETAKVLTDQLDALASKASLSSKEVEYAKTLIEELNGLGLDGIHAEWDDYTGKIQINTGEIYNNIEAIKENAKTVANQRILTKAYEAQGDALVDIATAQGMVDRAQTDYNNKLSQYQDVADAMGISLEQLGQQHWFQSIYLGEETYALGQAQTALDTANGRYKDATRVINDTEKALGYTTTAFTSNKDAAQKAGEIVANMGIIFSGTKGNVNDLANAIINANNLNPTFQKTKDSLGSLSGTAWATGQNVWTIANALNAINAIGKVQASVMITGALAALGRAEGGYVTGYADGGIIPSYASGGVNSADLFMANENGNPELVGRIGSRTAVANQGQMVEALASGLERIFSDGSGNASNIEVVVNMDSVAVARAADRGNKSLNRRFNVSLA